MACGQLSLSPEVKTIKFTIEILIPMDERCSSYPGLTCASNLSEYQSRAMGLYREGSVRQITVMLCREGGEGQVTMGLCR